MSVTWIGERYGVNVWGGAVLDVGMERVLELLSQLESGVLLPCWCDKCRWHTLSCRPIQPWWGSDHVLQQVQRGVRMSQCWIGERLDGDVRGGSVQHGRLE